MNKLEVDITAYDVASPGVCLTLLAIMKYPRMQSLCSQRYKIKKYTTGFFQRVLLERYSCVSVIGINYSRQKTKN